MQATALDRRLQCQKRPLEDPFTPSGRQGPLTAHRGGDLPTKLYKNVGFRVAVRQAGGAKVAITPPVMDPPVTPPPTNPPPTGNPGLPTVPRHLDWIRLANLAYYGTPLGSFELGVAAMQVSHDPFGIDPARVLAEIGLPRGVQRRQALLPAATGQVLDETQVPEHLVAMLDVEALEGRNRGLCHDRDHHG